MSGRVLFDNNFLSAFTYDSTKADFVPMHSHDTLQDRLNYLVECLADKEVEIIIPSHVFAELLAIPGADASKIIPIIETQSCFRIVDFGKRAAIEFGLLSQTEPSDNQTKRIFKFDLAIIVIAKLFRVSKIYSADKNLIKRAGRVGISCCDFNDLPQRPVEQQMAMVFTENMSIQ